MLNALTVDVEDYFQVSAFEKTVNPEEWDQYPLRIINNSMRILDLFDEYSVKATFFILGWVAEKCPALVKEIEKRGHEIGCHGYAHKIIYHIGPENFRKDIQKSKRLLEDICGKAINGYRAPSYSITKRSLWALDILIEEGFKYDSSIFPITHDRYGIRNALRFPHTVRRLSGSILEFPISTVQIKLFHLTFNIPATGGGYLRFFPVSLSKRLIRQINQGESRPAILYFHPWEIDPEQPKIRAGILTGFRHYYNLNKTLERVKYLLSAFKFAPVKKVLKLS